MAVGTFEEIVKRKPPSFEALAKPEKLPWQFNNMLSGERGIDTFLEPEDANVLNEHTDPNEKDKLINSLYLAAKYSTDSRLVSSSLDEIARQKWGDEKLSQSQIRQKLAEEHEEQLRQYYRDSFAPKSLFGQAFMQSLAGKPAMALRGVPVYTPGEALGFDGLLRWTSDYLLSLQKEEAKRKVEVAITGRLWPIYKGRPWYKVEPELLPETINTWAAMVGDQIPIMLMTWSGRMVGKFVGKPLGGLIGGIYALATAGPDPHDLVAAPAIALATAKIVEHLSGAAPLIAMEAGGFMDRANSIGIDKDIVEKYARPYGLGSGAIEYAQWLWNLKAFSRLTLKVRKSILKRVLLEIGGATWEGLEELSQFELEDFLIDKAVAEHKQRHPEYNIVEAREEGERARAFGIGFGVSLIIRMPGHAYTSIRKTKIADAIQDQTDATKEEATAAVEAMSEGGPLAEQTKKTVQEEAKRVAEEAEKPPIVPVEPRKPVEAPPITVKEVTEAIAGDEQLSGIQKRLDTAYKANDIKTFREIINTELVPLPPETAKNILQGHAELLLTAMEKRKVAPVPAVAVEAKPLRSKIHAVAARKGLTKKALSDLKLKHTGYRKLTGKIGIKKITTEQLQFLLKAVQKARPKQIGYKKVVTQKTERKIQSLKENLKKKTSMTEKDFREILDKEVRGKEPRYIDAKHFITQTEGNAIIRRMLDEAEIIRLTESYSRAVENNPEITQQVEKLDKKIAAQPKRDPYSLESMRYYNQQAEIKTDAPFFTVYMDLIDTHLENNKTRTATLKRLENSTPDFKAITQDEKSLKRVGDYIASQSNLAERPEMPKDITPGEIQLAQAIQKILKEYEIKVRTAKFFNFYYYNQPIPDADRYKKEITKAVDIYEGKGKEDLLDYLKTQEWGVIHSGYEPMENLFLKIQPYAPKPTAVGKGHIKIRTAIEYHTQERNVLQRLTSYMRQMDMLFNMSPKINAYVRLFDDNINKFNNPNKVKEDIEFFLQNLKRYNIQRGFFERNLARAYSQAMRVIIMPSPVLSFRNLFQNLAFEHDKSILIDPRNKNLSDADVEYIETYVLQQRAMIEEYFMVGEKPLPGLKFVTGLIDKIKIYPYSDITNRYWSFWAKKNQVNRAMENRSIEKIMSEAKFDDITALEQKRALSILAKDGEQAMGRYVSRVHVDDIHFLYERAQRSPAEMTVMGRVLGNLMLFPRAYGEKLARQTKKVISTKVGLDERLRAFKVISAVIAGGMMTGAIFRMVTGRRKNPYDPLEILSYEAGGLALGAIEAANEVYSNMLLALKGDERALAALTVAIPRAADMFIPFYDYSLRAIEAATDRKNIDRRALKRIRELIDKEYNVREDAYVMRRNALEKWQFFIAGAGVDQKIEEKRPKGRKGLGRGVGERGITRRGIER